MDPHHRGGYTGRVVVAGGLPADGLGNDVGTVIKCAAIHGDALCVLPLLVTAQNYRAWAQPHVPLCVPTARRSPRIRRVSLVPASMQRRGSSSGNVAKWASGRPWVENVQTFRRLDPPLELPPRLVPPFAGAPGNPRSFRCPLLLPRLSLTTDAA